MRTRSVRARHGGRKQGRARPVGATTGEGIGQSAAGINLEFFPINFQFAAEINFSSIASRLGKMVHEQEIEMKVLTKLFGDESGVTAIEYAFIAALIAVAAVGSIGLIGTDLSGTFSNVAGKL
jgi:pilus assembly protein Flp/PilA